MTEPTMSTNGAEPAAVVRRLDGEGAAVLRELVETFEELQTVLRCCERLVGELAQEQPDGVVVEAVWTMALLSYARCFTASPAGVVLTEEDLASAQPGAEALDWHQLLLQLRDHYADPVASPRERFTVGATQAADGTASGVAITSARQPLVDDLTVRQTGAVAYALSGLVNERIEAQQRTVQGELEQLSAADLEKLERLDVATTDPPPGPATGA
jgi:hypothetical protein